MLKVLASEFTCFILFLVKVSVDFQLDKIIWEDWSLVTSVGEYTDYSMWKDPSSLWACHLWAFLHCTDGEVELRKARAFSTLIWDVSDQLLPSAAGTPLQ